MQLFRRHQFHLDLLQTLDDHESAVSDVKFLDKTTLLSISSDRTIIVRKLAFGKVAFLPTRIITLKASPVSLATVPAQSNVVLVSTLDRQVCRYNVSSGRLLHSFKASDPTTGESLLMSSLEVHEVAHLPTASRLILGVSSTDKSIRVHEYDSGAMLAREYGQNSVSALKLFRRHVEGESPRDHLVSCGLDGTVMIWALSCNSLKSGASHDTPNSEECPSRQITPAAQPLRRILSKAELSDLQKSLSSKSDKVTPIPGSSPSCVRRKSSRYSAVAAPKNVASARPHPAGALPSPAEVRVQRQLSQSHTPTPPGQKITLNSRSKSSLDGRRRSKSAANLNDLNGLGEQICVSLRTFRSRITSSSSSSSSSSSVATLEHNTLPKLIEELNITIRALADKAPSNYTRGDVLDVRPPTVIDEKLDTKAKSKEIRFVQSPRREEKGLGKLGIAHVGEKGEALE